MKVQNGKWVAKSLKKPSVTFYASPKIMKWIFLLYFIILESLIGPPNYLKSDPENHRNGQFGKMPEKAVVSLALELYLGSAIFGEVCTAVIKYKEATSQTVLSDEVTNQF